MVMMSPISQAGVCSAHKRRSRCLSGVQWSGSLCNHSSARTVEHTGPYPLVQPSAQRHGTMRVDFAGQPQASPDQQRQDHPHDAHLDWTRLSSAYTCPRARGGATRGSCTVRPWTSTRLPQRATVRSSKSNAMTIACSGSPWVAARRGGAPCLQRFAGGQKPCLA
jgi:hypothetical protein